MHTKLNVNELEKLNEKELRQTIRQLQTEASKLYKHNLAPKAVDIEVEICYVQRELEKRSRFNKPRRDNPSNKNDQIEFETPV
jgi:hypothetical protein